MTKNLKAILLLGALGLMGLGASDVVSIPLVSGFISTAEARVGRPLTPISVAGVTRRTVRRCAVGVYNC